MSNVDVGSYNKFQMPAPPNMLEMQGQLQGLQQGALKNQLLQNEADAQNAIGEVLSQSMDENGQPDFNKMLTLMAVHQKLALSFPDYMKKLKDAQLVDTQVVQNKLENTVKRLGIIGSTAQSVLSDPGFVNAVDASAAKQAIIRHMAGTIFLDNTFTDAEKMAYIESIPDTIPEMKQWAQTAASQSMTGTDFGKMNLDSIKLVPLGNREAVWKTNPFTGSISEVGSAPIGPDPNRVNEPMPVWRPDGSQGIVRVGDQILGNLVATGGPFTLTGAAQTPAPAVPVEPETPATFLMNQQQPPAMSAPATMPPSGEPGPAPKDDYVGSVTLKPRPDLEITADNVKKFQEGLQDRALALPMAMSNVDASIDLLNKTNAGPGTEFRSEIGKYLSSVGASDELVNKVAGGDLEAIQVLQKLLLRNSVQEMQLAYGGKYQQYSDTEFKNFRDNSPSLNTKHAALQYMLLKTKSFLELQQFEQQAYAKWLEAHANNPIPGKGFPAAFAPIAVKFMEDFSEDNGFTKSDKKG